MSPTIMWTNGVGWAIVWEKQEMGEAPEVWLIAKSRDGHLCSTVNDSIDAELGTLFRSAEAAAQALSLWKESEGFLPESNFRVCYIRAAYVASEAGV